MTGPKLRTMHESITVDRVCDALESDEMIGFCLSCGDEAWNVEPDACGYPCETCDEPAVYGVQEILFMLPEVE